MTVITYFICGIITFLAAWRLADDYNPEFSQYSYGLNLNNSTNTLKPFERQFDVAFGLKNKDNSGITDPNPRFGRIKVEYVFKENKMNNKNVVIDQIETSKELDYHKCTRPADFGSIHQDKIHMPGEETEDIAAMEAYLN